MCKFMKVRRSSYYEWVNNPSNDRDNQDKEVISLIKSIYQQGRGTYGTRRIKKKLLQQGIAVSRRSIARLMKEAELFCKTKRKFKATTDSKHDKPNCS